MRNTRLKLRQLEQSTTVGSMVVTNSFNEQQYLAPTQVGDYVRVLPDGTIGLETVVPKSGIVTSEEQTAQAGQIDFIIVGQVLPSSYIYFYINGVRINSSAVSNFGSTITYTPLFNGNYVIQQGDRINFDVYTGALDTTDEYTITTAGQSTFTTSRYIQSPYKVMPFVNRIRIPLGSEVIPPSNIFTYVQSTNQNYQLQVGDLLQVAY
jgi:hypothetical protein